MSRRLMICCRSTKLGLRMQQLQVDISACKVVQVYCLFILIGVVVVGSVAHAQALSVDYYQSSCPNVAALVTQSITSSTANSNVVPPSLLRLIMHDCMVQGCDASILISSTTTNTAERDFPDNQSIRQEGFDAIEAAKEVVESACPGVVSCADILALAARDAVVLSKGPSWDVPLGRLDGFTSSIANAAATSPLSNFTFQQLTNSFQAVGLSVNDLVVLSGAHTIGFSHCNEFIDRVLNFNGTHTMDPSMDFLFARELQRKCLGPRVDEANALVPFDDTTTDLTFDNNYYRVLQRRRGLLYTDQVLFDEASTSALVNALAASQSLFFDSFVESMIRLTSIISTPRIGNIRRVCSSLT